MMGGIPNAFLPLSVNMLVFAGEKDLNLYPNFPTYLTMLFGLLLSLSLSSHICQIRLPHGIVEKIKSECGCDIHTDWTKCSTVIPQADGHEGGNDGLSKGTSVVGDVMEWRVPCPLW
jgi:hypothetical protein